MTNTTKVITYGTCAADNRWSVRIVNVDGYISDISYHAKIWTISLENDGWYLTNEINEAREFLSRNEQEALNIANSKVAA